MVKAHKQFLGVDIRSWDRVRADKKYPLKKQKTSLFSKKVFIIGYPKLFIMATLSRPNLIGNSNFPNSEKIPIFRPLVVEI